MRNKGNGLTRREVLKCGLYAGLAGAGLTGNLWLSSCRKRVKNSPPNIFLITVDTLRADHLGCYNYFRNTSPNIDRFAEDSLLFEKCQSHAPVTSSSFASILSGFLPHETKVFENLPLPEKLPILQESLKQNGYKTIAVVSNYAIRKEKGWARGFTMYDDEMTTIENVRHHPERIAEETTNRAIKLLKQFHKDRIFMWIHYQDPHGPYTPPKRYSNLFPGHRQKPNNLMLNKAPHGYGGIPSYQKLGDHRDYYYYVSQYDLEIRYMDEQFKILIDTLKKYDQYDENLIIFSADHGEGMGEHNYYFAHGDNLYNSQLHVPLIMRYGNTLKGRRSDFVQHLDIVPTIKNIVGIKKDTRLRGTDLFKQGSKKKEIFAEMKLKSAPGRGKFSITIDGLKLIHSLREGFELFNLEEDPYEKQNLITNPDYMKQKNDLFTRLNHIREENAIGLNIVNKPHLLTEEEKRKMRSLGYVQ